MVGPQRTQVNRRIIDYLSHPSPTKAVQQDHKQKGWLPEEDDFLWEQKNKNKHWDTIASELAIKYPPPPHVAPKTGNACRKRYGRLRDKKRTEVVGPNGENFPDFVNEYVNQRELIWAPLAKSLGMKRWSDAEKIFVSVGLPTIMQTFREMQQDSLEPEDDRNSSYVSPASSNSPDLRSSVTLSSVTAGGPLQSGRATPNGHNVSHERDYSYSSKSVLLSPPNTSNSTRSTSPGRMSYVHHAILEPRIDLAPRMTLPEPAVQREFRLPLPVSARFDNELRDTRLMLSML